MTASYDSCLPFSLPSTHNERDRFLDEILTPFVDPTFLAKAKKDAEFEYSVVLHKDTESSLHIWVKGNDPDAYMPGIVPNQTGDPKSHVECVLREAVNAKKDSNDLKNHHPNLVAVSLLLSEDFQLSLGLKPRLQSLTLPQIDPNIDAFAISTIGIDERLTKEELKVVVRTERSECRALNQIASEFLIFDP